MVPLFALPSQPINIEWNVEEIYIYAHFGDGKKSNFKHERQRERDRETERQTRRFRRIVESFTL